MGIQILLSIVMMNNLLQMAATESSMDLALKLFTAKPLQYYHQQPARSRITCAAICKEDHRDKCTGFSFDNKECLLYNTHINMQTDEHSREALAIFVFGDEKDVAKYEDCQAAFENGHSTSGVYTLQPAGFNAFNAWCDFDGSNGWTVIQRRTEGNVDFDRNWDESKKGFGYLNGDLWLGNDNIHALTLTNKKLSISLTVSGADYTTNYSTFSINDEGDNYRLDVSGYNGDLYDGMAESSGYNLDGMKFTTRDRDNDMMSDNCAQFCSGPWWHKACTRAHLNGPWPIADSSNDRHNMLWLQDFPLPYTHPRASTMRITRS